MRTVNLLLVALFVTGCTSLGPRFQEKLTTNKNLALVYIYRVKRFAGSAVNPYVCLNGRVVGEAVNGGYFPIEVEKGQHQILLRSMGHVSAGSQFNLEPGTIYYLRIDYSLNGQAKSESENTRVAALGPGGGGALGAAIGGAFYGNNEQAAVMIEQVDRRAQKEVSNPGFLMVKGHLGVSEIQETKLFSVPDYKTNPCQTK